jgi:TolB-like protein
MNLNRIGNELTDKINATTVKTVAVMYFRDNQEDITELGKYFSDEITASILGNRPNFSVVDRSSLDTILIEHKLASTGLVSPETIKKLGKMIGAQAIVVGTYVTLESTYAINIRVLDVESSKVIAAARGEIARTQAYDRMALRTVKNISSGELKEDGGTTEKGKLGKSPNSPNVPPVATHKTLPSSSSSSSIGSPILGFLLGGGFGYAMGQASNPKKENPGMTDDEVKKSRESSSLLMGLLFGGLGVAIGSGSGTTKAWNDTMSNARGLQQLTIMPDCGYAEKMAYS